MPRFKIAHVREQGVNLIIVPLDGSFGRKTNVEQNEIVNELQRRANGAGLAGTVVPVWLVGKRVSFLAPRNWHPFFKSLSWNDVLASINREVYW